MSATFSSLAEQLTTRAARAAVSLIGPRSEPLREHLRRAFEARAGAAVPAAP